MKSRWIVALGLAALLGGCAFAPRTDSVAADRTWNDGIWNSVMGYHGPANTIALSPSP